MEVVLPDGCNVFYGSYLDNYSAGYRTRYYYTDGQLIPSTRQAYTTYPQGYQCMDSLFYNPALRLDMVMWAMLLCVLIGCLLYRLFRKLLP